MGVPFHQRVTRWAGSAWVFTAALVGCGTGDSTAPDLPPPSSSKVHPPPISASKMAALGRLVFHDQNLSLNRNQSCASCHAAAWGFSSPIAAVNAGGAVVAGSFSDRFGTR